MNLWRAFTRAALVAGLCLASASSLQAQTTSASVSGSVRDASGASLPGAMVTMTSKTQGGVMTAVTDVEGNFLFPYVRPDTYILKITLDGFQTFEQTSVVVNANDKFGAGIITMEVGQLTESITVEGRSALVQSESGERSYTLESKAISNIAVNGRSFFSLAPLVAGVVANSDAPTPSQVSNFTANGQRPNSNNFTIDGISNVDTGDNGGNMATTNLEAVAEFKILTSSYQAEYGRAVGAQVSVVTKSGTQNFSGSGYWYGRRSDWNANSWINNRNGLPVQPSERNDSGYTIGGPVYIPGGFNADRKKLFFFFAQEYQNRMDPQSAVNGRVPTELERQGDFSQSVDNSGNPFPYVRDYTTGLPCGPTDTRGCFQDGGVLGRIPQDRLYAPTLAALSLFPMPNFSGIPGRNYTSQTPVDQPRREEMFRADYNYNDSWRFTGRAMHNKDSRSQPYGVAWAVGSNVVDDVLGKFDVPGYNIAGTAVGVLNNTTSLEITGGVAHNSLDIYTTADKLKRSASAIGDMPMLFPDAVQGDWIPEFRFDNGRLGGCGTYCNTVTGSYITRQAPFTNFNTTIDLIGNLTKVKGQHAIKTGIYYQKSLKDQSAFAPFNGMVDFRDDANNPYDTGFPYANAAVGVYWNYQQASVYAKPKWRYTNLEWFVQDNWKASPRLTLDYGIRFYYLTPQWDVSKQASNFLPGEYDPAQAVRLFEPAIINGQRVGYDAQTGQTVAAGFIGRVVPGSGNPYNGSFQAGQGISETLTSGNAFKVSPRIGAAYDLSGEQTMVLRGGFGIFYDRPQGNMVFNLIQNPPGMSIQSLSWGVVPDLSSATPLNGVINLNPNQYDFEIPAVYQWNVGIQRRLPMAFTLDVAYVGSVSRNLIQALQINSVPYGGTYLPENQDSTLTPSATPGASALPVDFLRPYPGYGNIAMLDYGAWANYNGLQTSLNRRFDKGLLLGVNYTWSKALGVVDTDFATGRFDGKDANRRANYGPLSYDRPHVFTANFVYQLPNRSTGAMAFLANDWQVSGIYRLISGVPYGVGFNIPGISSVNLTGSDGNNNARVVLTGDPGSGHGSDPYRQFNTSVFAPPQPGSQGFESARYLMYGPGINNLDLSLSKSFRFANRVRTEIRLDAFNALNHTQFSGVNNRIDFASLTDRTITNLPYDASGNLVNRDGFGTVSGVRNPRELQLVARISF